MDATELKTIQAPIKERYRSDPVAASITLRADAALGEGITCSVNTAQAMVRAGLHPDTGGDGLSACSGDMLLQALAACAGVTMRSVATSIGVEVEGNVHTEGDIDWRGTMAIDRETPVGFSDIRLRFDLETTATDDELATLLRLTERYCVVFQTLRLSPRLEATINRQPAA